MNLNAQGNGIPRSRVNLLAIGVDPSQQRRNSLIVANTMKMMASNRSINNVNGSQNLQNIPSNLVKPSVFTKSMAKSNMQLNSTFLQQGSVRSHDALAPKNNVDDTQLSTLSSSRRPSQSKLQSRPDIPSIEENGISFPIVNPPTIQEPYSGEISSQVPIPTIQEPGISIVVPQNNIPTIAEPTDELTFQVPQIFQPPRIVPSIQEPGSYSNDVTNGKPATEDPGHTFVPEISFNRPNNTGESKSSIAKDILGGTETPVYVGLRQRASLSVSNSKPLLRSSLPEIGSGGDSNVQDSAQKQAHQEAIQRIAKTPLHGQMIYQLAFHYISFIMFAIVAGSTWSGGSVVTTRIALYCTLSFITLETSRLIYRTKPDSMWPMYLTLFPFFAILNVMRNENPLFMVIWFVETLILFLQSGNINMKQHMLVYSACFMISYLVRVYFMLYVPVCSLQDPAGISSCLVLGSLPHDINIPFLQVGFVSLSCIMVIFCCMMLEAYIKRNALTLLDHENYLNALFLTNMDLNRALRRFNRKKDQDLNAPISTVIETLNEIKTGGLSAEIQEQIDLALKNLTSKDLFSLTLSSGVDTELQGFLEDVLQAAKKADATPALEMISEGIEEDSEEDVAEKNDSELAIQESLKSITLPDFDVLSFDKLCGGQPIYHVGLHCFHKHKLHERLAVDNAKLRNFLQKVDGGYYATNPYHNAKHGADVTVMMNKFISTNKFTDSGPGRPAQFPLAAEDILACIVGALIHDFQHPGEYSNGVTRDLTNIGRNNAFLIATKHPIALRYNDAAVLESFHAASAFELISTDKSCDFLSALSGDARKRMRELVVALVLGTDMAQHFEFIGRFKNKLLTPSGIEWDKSSDRKLVLTMIMKASDVNNPTKPLNLGLQWTDMIMEEFFQQGDDERARGLQVSSFMDRATTDIPKSQLVSHDLCGMTFSFG